MGQHVWSGSSLVQSWAECHVKLLEVASTGQHEFVEILCWLVPLKLISDGKRMLSLTYFSTCPGDPPACYGMVSATRLSDAA